MNIFTQMHDRGLNYLAKCMVTELQTSNGQLSTKHTVPWEQVTKNVPVDHVHF